MEINKPAPSGGLLRRTFTGFFWILLGSGVQVALKIGVLAVLARLVTPNDFGLMGIALIVIEFSKMFTHMGVGPALVQRTEIEERHLTTGFTLSLIIGAVFALVLLPSAQYIAVFFRMPELTRILQVLSLVFLIDSFTLIAQALMQRNMNFKINAAIEVLSYAIGYGMVGIPLAYFGWGVWALVAASLSQSILLTTLLLLVQPFPKKIGFNKQAFKDLIFFGGGFTIAKIANFLATQGDNLIVGRLLGARALGIYGRAYQFMVMPAGLFGNALDRALFPAMSKVQHEGSRVAKAYLTGVSLIATIAIPLSFLSVILAPEIVFIALGKEWADVIPPFQILACSLLFRMSYKMSDSLARATGAVYRRAWRQIIYAAMVITGTYVGHFWGLAGVAWGVAAALVVNFLLMAQLSLQLTNIRWHEMVTAHKAGLLVGVITGLVSHALATLCRMNHLPDLMTLFITGGGTGITLLLTLVYFPDLIMSLELKEMYEKLITRRFRNLFPKNA
ncbi:MAG TPA: lipopolysaccharide biosynthesis protein [Chryseosolibacter sp.]|nr:lipopolysaccharide biosynthesis protein [Chryseosolibacter sp.]